MDKHFVQVDGIDIPYRVVVSNRARALRITVRPGGECIVTQPKRASLAFVHNSVQKKKQWLYKTYVKMQRVQPVLQVSKSESKRMYTAYKERARAFISERVRYWSSYYPYPFSKIVIRNQKSRWGSCSHTGVLSFNYKLYFLAPELVDYVVVHELCHLQEMNHSRSFWCLVEKHIKNYRDLRGQLRAHSLS
jgi:predicted metal-dependent hydrolase